MKAKLLTGLLATFASMLSSVTYATDSPAPPPYVRFVISSTQVQLPTLQLGKEYAIFTSFQPTGSYTATITTLNGVTLYQGVPVSVGSCTQDPNYWPDLLDGRLVDRRTEPETIPSLDLSPEPYVGLWLWCPLPKQKDGDPGKAPTPGIPRSTPSG